MLRRTAPLGYFFHFPHCCLFRTYETVFTKILFSRFPVPFIGFRAITPLLRYLSRCTGYLRKQYALLKNKVLHVVFPFFENSVRVLEDIR